MSKIAGYIRCIGACITLLAMFLFIEIEGEISAACAEGLSECRAGYVPTKETYSTCRSKFINICSCECRGTESTENLVCRSKCLEEAECNTCLRYAISAIETEESILSAQLCDVSTDLLNEIRWIKKLRANDVKGEFKTCVAQVVRQNIVASSVVSSVSTKLEIRLAAHKVAFDSVQCAFSTYGESIKNYNSAYQSYIEHRRRFYSLSAKFDYYNDYKKSFAAAAKELTSCNIMPKEDDVLCPSRAEIQRILGYKNKFQ